MILVKLCDGKERRHKVKEVAEQGQCKISTLSVHASVAVQFDVEKPNALNLKYDGCEKEEEVVQKVKKKEII